jgi:Zn finger protein HypA/HybF involved in hydrogenase expression
MRKLQAELSFEDSSYKANRAIERISAETTHFDTMPLPRRQHRMKVVCLKCSMSFSTTSQLPSCPGCGDSDVELA